MTEAVRHHLESDAANGNRAALQAELEHNTQLIRFFTPLCKYHATEISNHVTRPCIQAHGGIGYMAESPAGHYHSDSIITTIYEGTSEIQAGFALKVMGKGALFTTLERTRTDLQSLSDAQDDLVRLVCDGINKLTGTVGALMGDPQYALLNAKRVCEMVIDVVLSAELLFQAAGGNGKREPADRCSRRHVPAVRANG